jgi:hypothetical protein
MTGEHDVQPRVGCKVSRVRSLECHGRRSSFLKPVEASGSCRTALEIMTISLSVAYGFHENASAAYHHPPATRFLDCNRKQARGVFRQAGLSLAFPVL